MKENDLITIQNRIDYRFKNLDLLVQAFTRRSYSEENGGNNNEVLEFFGDKVLDFVVTKYLISQNSNAIELNKDFEAKPNGTRAITLDFQKDYSGYFVSEFSEAELTEMRKNLVCKKTLATRIDKLGLADYLIMGKGDVAQNKNDENSVKEDLFEAIIGAVAIDCGCDTEVLQGVVSIMLSCEEVLADNSGSDYISLIKKWAWKRFADEPLFHIEARGYSPIATDMFRGISQKPKSLEDREIMRTNFTCYLEIKVKSVFRAYGKSISEAKQNVCKLAYEYLEKEGLWLSIRDEIDNPNKDDAINQLEILARRGYFSIPVYDFEQKYDKDGNPVWGCICCIDEKERAFCAKSSAKKDAKKSAAFKMLQYVLGE